MYETAKKLSISTSISDPKDCGWCYAQSKGQERISKEDVSSALNKLRMTFDRTLSEDHKRKLLEINRCKEAREEGPESVLTRELLFSLTAVEYQDEVGRWCEVDPMLLPLVEKWSRSL